MKKTDHDIIKLAPADQAAYYTTVKGFAASHNVTPRTVNNWRLRAKLLGLQPIQRYRLTVGGETMHPVYLRKDQHIPDAVKHLVAKKKRRRG
jgi:hypothetical protein